MTTLPPPRVKEFPAESVEKKVYNVVENFAQYIPLPNDRNRLGYCLYKYLKGEGDEPKIALKSAKINIEGIKTNDLAKRLDEELSKIK
jgi:hypothetical protein